MDAEIQSSNATKLVTSNLSEEFGKLVEREVLSWYESFYRWTRALCEREESEVHGIYRALSTDFRVLLTNGTMMNKDEYWHRLLSLYGERSGDPPSHITNLDLRSVGHDHALVTFDLFKKGVLKKKFDSALLRAAPALPGGVEWVYVHESDHAISAVPALS